MKGVTHKFWRILAPARRDRGPVLVVVSIYLLSCLLPAGRTPGAGKGDWENTYLGGVLLINGFTWICGCVPFHAVEDLWKGHGGELGQLSAYTLLNWSPWLANPLFWCGVWQLRLGRCPRASIVASAAVVLGGLFFVSELMREQSIGEYPAFYVWLTSPAVLAGFSLMPRTATQRDQAISATDEATQKT